MLATIGYEKATLDDFVATLKEQNVEVLADIRDRAQSRRKGFSKTALSEALNEVGIKYIHLKALGDPKPGREAARAGDFDRFRQIFDGVMQSNEAKEALDVLREMLETSNVCLMCYERDPMTCHRKIVSDKLKSEAGGKVQHFGVRLGKTRDSERGRMLHSDQGAAA
ncbi:DUF488 domain-containing protein [Ponticaulis sp.]|uniref:DUF488 domain-containing protein n=1 Tax=Ponticaulis sp. TaxID=2020902 RepID=UPI0026105A01|nr:DUF488 domain-containing protein [Ponticaulis sp.]MDF1679437.1 DUF488 domain-containing protein [Ponticaulis sp.]